MRSTAKRSDQVLALRDQVVAWLGLVRGAWKSLALTTQYMSIVAIVLMLLWQASSFMQYRIAERSVIASSLDVERAMLQSMLAPAIGTEPLTRANAAEVVRRIDLAVRAGMNIAYIERIKVWGSDGHLVYDSRQMADLRQHPVPAVEQALGGTTVLSWEDTLGLTDGVHVDHASGVYEVYMPIYNASGTLLAVGELYSSIDLVAGRIDAMIDEMDRVRLVVLLVAAAVLGLLVKLAQRRLTAQEAEIARRVAQANNLSRQNALLLRESESLRSSMADANEELLGKLGAELHDGPIQLLSIAALYRSQLPLIEGHEHVESKARVLSDNALRELRNISTGLILPELAGSDLADTVRKAVQTFTRDTEVAVFVDAAVTSDFPLPTLVAVYRIVYESLNNARKHSNGQGLSVRIFKRPDGMGLDICNRLAKCRETKGTTRPALQDGGLGMLGMRRRARSVGASLDFVQEDDRMIVRLELRAALDPAT